MEARVVVLLELRVLALGEELERLLELGQWRYGVALVLHLP
jgi:hypothetical protein